MKTLNRVTVDFFLGALFCSMLSMVSFSVLALSDGTKLETALASGAVVGFVGAVIGAIIGFIIGIMKLGSSGGGLVGLLTTAFLILFYILIFSRPGQVMDFISESLIIPVVMVIPLILTGYLVGIVNKRIIMYPK